MTIIADLSPTMRDYLIEIYYLSEENKDQEGYVGTSALAAKMMVSAPAVNRMVSKLKELGFLIHEPYHGVKLTPEGKCGAMVKMRYQRIVEVFLIKVMGFGWHEIYEEAYRMSSALDAAVAQRMLEMTGYPTRCPHGEPIPDENGVMAEPDDTPLADMDVEDCEELEITRVRTRESDRLEYIAALGLTPGTRLQLIHKAPFSGPMQLKLGAEYRIIGHNLAEHIHVTCVKPVE